MPGIRPCLLLLAAVMLIAAAGCSNAPRNWDITVDNKSGAHCSVYVVVLGGAQYQTERLRPSKSVTIASGSAPTEVQGIRVSVGPDEQDYMQNIDLPLGKRLAITVNPGATMSYLILNK